MLFNLKEKEELVELLSGFSTEDSPYLTPEKAEELLNSTLKKLQNLSNITYFSKQEFTFLYTLVCDEFDFYNAINAPRKDLKTLMNKLSDLSEVHQD